MGATSSGSVGISIGCRYSARTPGWNIPALWRDPCCNASVHPFVTDLRRNTKIVSRLELSLVYVICPDG